MDYTYEPDVTKFITLKLPSGLKQGWNAIRFDISELEIDLSRIQGFRISTAEAWSNSQGVNATGFGEACRTHIAVDGIFTARLAAYEPPAEQPARPDKDSV